jgi:diguanylate cyclase (GGDEF)-like protein
MERIDKEPQVRPGPFDRSTRPLIRSDAAIGLLALATLLVIAWLDRISGTQLSLTPLYLLPVAVIAWYLGRTSGQLFGLAASAARLLADLTTTQGAPSAEIIVWNVLMVLVLSTVVGEVLTRLHHALDTESDLARTDALTGVSNSRSFHELATLELERSRRYGRVFTIACLDLDHFKSVNDTLGHDTGDRLLKDIGHAVRARLRRVDIVARLGGDEFMLLLPETGADAAAVALEHVRSALDSLTDSYGPQVKASIGAVTFTKAPESVSDMVRLADTAMYRAKAGGRDRIESITLPFEADRLEEFELTATCSLASRPATAAAADPA